MRRRLVREQELRRRCERTARATRLRYADRRHGPNAQECALCRVAIETAVRGVPLRSFPMASDGYEGPATIDKLAALARRRGFVFPASDIYGGIGSTYDYGHYGVLLKSNVKQRWLDAMLR